MFLSVWGEQHHRDLSTWYRDQVKAVERQQLVAFWVANVCPFKQQFQGATSLYWQNTTMGRLGATNLMRFSTIGVGWNLDTTTNLHSKQKQKEWKTEESYNDLQAYTSLTHPCLLSSAFPLFWGYVQLFQLSFDSSHPVKKKSINDNSYIKYQEQRWIKSWSNMTCLQERCIFFSVKQGALSASLLPSLHLLIPPLCCCSVAVCFLLPPHHLHHSWSPYHQQK